MVLKSIEVQGFKSFADKMEFQFQDGITAIVGPNGSGKSNVADAVLWVFGEQSAKSLRGSSMQDVIFSGTETRRPLGMAAVSLTLDNSDHTLSLPYEEVTVTRRLYRSGESEYLLNGTQVRLRDIQDLFCDTGIGKEGYSVIGQGQIDRILSAKPEDRRELFDEAAGIVKFKRRKKTALKKLETEQQNLTRVRDILSEISRELSPLKEQAETAKIYLQKTEQQKRLDANLFLLEEEKNRRDLSSLGEKQRIVQEQLRDVKAEQERTRTKYERAEQEIEDLDASLRQKRDEDAQVRLDREQLENRIRILREQINTVKSSREQMTARISAISQQAEEYRSQEEQALSEGEEQKKQTEKVRTDYDQSRQKEREAKAACQALEQEVEQNKSAVIDLLNQRANLKARMQRYRTMSEQLQLRKKEIHQELQRLSEEEESRQSAGTEAKKEFDAITARIEKIRAEAEEKASALLSVQKKLDAASQKMEEDKTRFTRASSRLESLKNIAERYDGYSSSIRKVMERRGSDPGILGVVADLIQVDKEYETAIKTALGGSIQNIVTDTEETARREISYLKQNRLGRVTFLPLSGLTVRGGFSKPQALKEKGVIGLASDLVRTEDRYQLLSEFLLGRTIVVQSMEEAIPLARKYQHALRLVTIDGELFSPGGSISGGAFSHAGNLLGRRREIEELESEVKKEARALDQLSQTIEETRQARTRLRGEQNQRNETLQKETLAQNTAKLQLENLNDKSGSAATSFEKLQAEEEEIRGQEKEIAAHLEKEKEDLSQSEQKEKQIEDKTGQLQDQLGRSRKEEEARSFASHQFQLTLSRQEQQQTFLTQNLDRIRTEQARLAAEKDQLEEEISSSAGSVAKREEEISAISERLSGMDGEINQRAEEIRTLQEKREEISSLNKQFFEEREALSDRGNLLERESFRLQTQAEKLTEQTDSRSRELLEEYGLTPDSAKELRDESLSAITPLRKERAALKSEIRALGDVNVKAIEEYRELSERHSFLSAQQEDLQNAEHSLRKVIRDLDEGMRTQFEEEFAKIQKEFNKTFRELFGGGHGELELSADEDSLDAGILINAQPPGKKLQNMMQLSGGERALTAIALLFAIQNLKPSPFCLLDEIEAALDETNVDRFTHYLRQLTKNTQFIIITHRRGAMNAADRLYGITMQEKGVSALVSVSLIESQLDK